MYIVSTDALAKKLIAIYVPRAENEARRTSVRLRRDLAALMSFCTIEVE